MMRRTFYVQCRSNAYRSSVLLMKRFSPNVKKLVGVHIRQWSDWQEVSDFFRERFSLAKLEDWKWNIELKWVKSAGDW